MHLDHAVAHPHRHTHSADPLRPDGTRRALRIGLGGPVGSGKTATVAALCRALRTELSMAVVTNDIYTREDAEFLLREAVLPPERITAVETGPARTPPSATTSPPTWRPWRNWRTPSGTTADWT